MPSLRRPMLQGEGRLSAQMLTPSSRVGRFVLSGRKSIRPSLLLDRIASARNQNQAPSSTLLKNAAFAWIGFSDRGHERRGRLRLLVEASWTCAQGGVPSPILPERERRRGDPRLHSSISAPAKLPFRRPGTPEYGRMAPQLAELGPNSVNIGPIPSIPGRVRPKVAGFRLISVEFRPHLVPFGPMLAGLAHNLPRCQANLADVSRIPANWASFRRNWSEFDRNSADFGRRRIQLRPHSGHPGGGTMFAQERVLSSNMAQCGAGRL